MIRLCPVSPSIRAATPRLSLRRLGGRLAIGLSAGLAACGGGSGADGGVSSDVAAGGTGAYSVGPISGFGSVIVNGVRYDDSTANVFDDDGNRLDRDALKLGMVVAVRGTVSGDRTTGTASEVTYSSEIKGPVTAVDAAGGTFTVFGQAIRVTPRTVFADIGNGLYGLSAGNVVEVYALADSNGRLEASRIERESLTVSGFGGDYRVRGTVQGLTGNGNALRFVVSTVTITTGAATRVDGSVREGGFVSVRLGRTASADGSYGALRVQSRDRRYGNDIGEAEIEGFVSGFRDPAEPFRVNGFPVRLASSVEFDDGVRGDLANGVRVEAEGSVVGGVLVARKLEFERDDDDDSGFEFKGAAACTDCRPTEGTFTIRGVAVRYDDRTRFSDGASPLNLDGRRVEVHAAARSGAHGTTFVATRIERDD